MSRDACKVMHLRVHQLCPALAGIALPWPPPPLLPPRYPGVRLHTHLAENDEDILYMDKAFQQRPLEYVQ